MNIVDLGSIDGLVRRNPSLLTAFKVIDGVNKGVVIKNIQDNVREFGARKVIFRSNVLDIVTESGAIPISYYFADSYSESDIVLILFEVREFCRRLDVDFIG